MSEAKDPTGSPSPDVTDAPSTKAADEGVLAPPSEDAAGGEPPADASPRRKKRKKRKAEATEDAEASLLRPELDASGRERPKFLLHFPVDAELELLMAAFEAGNYFKVREEAPRLMAKTTRPEVKAAAAELLRRIEPDPLLKFFLGVAVALFVAVVAYVYYAHG